MKTILLLIGVVAISGCVVTSAKNYAIYNVSAQQKSKVYEYRTSVGDTKAYLFFSSKKNKFMYITKNGKVHDSNVENISHMSKSNSKLYIASIKATLFNTQYYYSFIEKTIGDKCISMRHHG